jgi:hypothetical protein
MHSDNGAVFTGGPCRGGRVALEVVLVSRGIGFRHSRPYHPQTCGKICEDCPRCCTRPGLTPVKV